MRRLFVCLAATGALAACLSISERPSAPQVEIQDLNWVSDDADKVAHLTQQPTACLPDELSPAARRGELLFNSPFLLGGQAAKAQLSCGSCHRNGRDNPDFVFAGISGPPGTADVTHAFFGPMRADRQINPVPIPDLANAAAERRVDRDQAGVLEAFLTAQIVEEFSGSPPESQWVADVAAYVRAIDTRQCMDTAMEHRSWAQEWARVETGIQAAQATPEPASRAYGQAARAALGRLFQRYPAIEHTRLRRHLTALSLAIRDGEDWINEPERLAAIAASLERSSSTSLYDASTLARYLR